MQNFRHLMLVTFASVSLLFSITARAESVINNEYQAVIDTAFNYFNGVAKGDQSLLSTAFDMEFGHIKMIKVDEETGNETIRSLPLSEFASYFKEATKDIWKAKVLSVDIVDEKMAMVKLDFDTPKEHYVDYLVMYKRGGHWRIINKTFVANKK